MRILSDKDVDSYYQISVVEDDIGSISLIELNYNRLIKTLDINDKYYHRWRFLSMEWRN